MHLSVGSGVRGVSLVAQLIKNSSVIPDAGKDGRREEKGTRGWNGSLAWPDRWLRVWASSRSWWWTESPGVLPSMRLQRVRHHWVTELTEPKQRLEVLPYRNDFIPSWMCSASSGGCSNHSSLGVCFYLASVLTKQTVSLCAFPLAVLCL